MRHNQRRATWRWRHFTTTTTTTTQKVWSLRFLFPHSGRRSADVRSASELQCGHLYETRNNFMVCVNLTMRLLWTTKSRFSLILGWSLQGERKYVMTWELTECVRPAMSLAVFECECLAVYLMSFNNTKNPQNAAFSDKPCHFRFLYIESLFFSLVFFFWTNFPAVFNPLDKIKDKDDWICLIYY